MAKPELSPDTVVAYMRELAEEIMLPKYNQLGDAEKRQKAPGDYVTVVDIEMERRLNRILPDLLPGSVVVGEEAVSDNPSLLKAAYNEDYVWLVDPLDGTNNFANGKREFCVMVALHYKGETVMSAIYDPLGKKVVTAEKGQGAYANATRLECRDGVDFEFMHGQINYNILPNDAARSQLKDKAANAFAGVKRLGCAGHDFIMHTEGSRHFSLYSRLAPWDFAPGGLILREAGGKLERVDGEEIRPFDYGYKLLSANGEESWEELKSFLLDH